MRTALVCSALRSGGGAALAGAAENLRDLTTTMLVCGVCYTDDNVVVCSQSGLNSKNPPKMGFQKFVKSTGYTYDCTNLTNFECEAHLMTGNGNHVNLLLFF